ncbi:MAG: hypothetical protein P4L31_01300 [Candidatus Babeliales bacterium]|nr:hypothetical protein [Candidatus Babeliales bacterium]
MKTYQAKLPYIVLIMISSLLADYIYYNVFRPQALILIIAFAPLIILKADWFCFFPKEDKLNMHDVLMTGTFIALIMATGIIIMRLLHSTHLTFMSACMLFICAYIFLYLVDASRYTDTR